MNVTGVGRLKAKRLVHAHEKMLVTILNGMLKERVIHRTRLRLTVGAINFHLQLSYNLITSCLNATCENVPGRISWVQVHLNTFRRYY